MNHRRFLAFISLLVLVACGVVTAGPSGSAVAAGSGFVAVSPARLADSRPGATTIDGIGAGGGPVGTGGWVDVVVTGRGGVPASGAVAVALNVTAASPTSGGFATVWPTGESRPNASNLNWVAGDVVANLVIVKVGTGGKVSIFNSGGTTHFLVDVVGWFDATGIEPVSPARLLDTRPGATTVDGVSAGIGALGPGVTANVLVSGRGGVGSSGLTAVVLNITAASSNASGYTTVWPTGEPMPNASNLNWGANVVVPNLVVVKVGANGYVSLFNSAGNTNYIVDVVGYFTTANAFVPLSPARAADTRSGATTIDGLYSSTGRPGSTVAVDVRLTGRGGVPASGVGAVIANVTAVGPVSAGYTTVFPTGEALPNASNLNFANGVTRPNLVISKLGAGGKLTTYTSAGSGSGPYYVVDVVGYFPGTAPASNDLPVRTAIDVVSGADFSCALVLDGTVRCWGYNGDGALGDGTNMSRSVPVQVQGITTATQITASADHACALLADTTVRCWGYNASGQLGNGTYVNSSMPVTVPGLSGVAQVNAGVDNTCAVLTDTGIRCWGSNSLYQFGNGTYVGSSVPAIAANGTTGWSSVRSGLNHTCAVTTTGSLYCWGVSDHGQVGAGTFGIQKTPTGPILPNVHSFGTGWVSTCAALVRPDNGAGEVRCWGELYYNNSLQDSATPNTVAYYGTPTVSDTVSVGGYGYCVSRPTFTQDLPLCRGWNYYGQLGTTTNVLTNNLTSATFLFDMGGFAVPGYRHTCAVTRLNGVMCSGLGNWGAVGNGTSWLWTSPQPVVGFTGGSTSFGAMSMPVSSQGHVDASSEEHVDPVERPKR